MLDQETVEPELVHALGPIVSRDPNIPNSECRQLLNKVFKEALIKVSIETPVSDPFRSA